MAYYCYYKNGFTEGDFVEFYQDGKLKFKEKMLKGQTRGVMNIWYDTGEKKCEGEYKFGICLSYTEWDKKGNIITQKVSPTSGELEILKGILIMNYMTNIDIKALIEKYSKIQNELLSNVKLENNFNKKDISTIAGVDLANWNEKETPYGTCSVVVIDVETKEVIEKVHSYGEITTPYIPGFLAFRELPLILKAVEKLMREPDLYMFDGNGYYILDIWGSLPMHHFF